MGRKIGSFGLINYRRHPENPNYIVFGFNSEREATIFETELNKTKTWFEKDSEPTDDGIIYLFAVLESSMNEANLANGAVKRHTREPMFKNILLRYSLIIFILLLSALALIGYVKNSDKRSEKSSNETTDTTRFTP